MAGALTVTTVRGAAPAAPNAPTRDLATMPDGKSFRQFM
jgi:hypothetical protein